MAEYIYIPNGHVVSVDDGKQMPSALFKPVEKPAQKKATTPRKRTTAAKKE